MNVWYRLVNYTPPLQVQKARHAKLFEKADAMSFFLMQTITVHFL